MIIDYEFKIEPRFSDTDLYGVMHHSNYFKWFEEARCHFANEVLGFTSQWLNGEEMKFLVVDAKCKYKESIRYGDSLKIDLKFILNKSAKMIFKYKITNLRTRKISAIGETTHVFVNKDNKMCMSIPNIFLEKLKQVEEEGKE